MDTWEFLNGVYEPLFQLNGKFQPEPVLCESYAWDETGRICTLTLRQGVSFHDGSPLTARDAAATLQRAAASDRYGYRLRGMASAAGTSSRTERRKNAPARPASWLSWATPGGTRIGWPNAGAAAILKSR